MISVDTLVLNKDNIDEIAGTLTSEDIRLLVSLLGEKTDELRYTAFLTLQKRSRLRDDVYPYWEEFCSKLESDNSYQRSLDIMLLAENVRWDREDRFDKILSSYLKHCEDEKFITSRQTIQSINVWITDKPQYHGMVAERLMKIDILPFKESQRKLIIIDILGVLAAIQNISPRDDIMDYTHRALTGEYLDKKSKTAVEKLFNF